MFTNLTTLAAPNLTAGTADTASGTLLAGTYSYRYTSRTYWGESLPSVEHSVVLSGTGRITITNATVSAARGYRVYRKAPGDSTWKFLSVIASGATTTFTDDGSPTPGADMSGIDTRHIPQGLRSEAQH